MWKPPKLLTETEAICTGFARIVADPGPDTLGLTLQRPEREMGVWLNRDECAQLAAILIRYCAT